MKRKCRFHDQYVCVCNCGDCARRFEGCLFLLQHVCYVVCGYVSCVLGVVACWQLWQGSLTGEPKTQWGEEAGRASERAKRFLAVLVLDWCLAQSRQLTRSSEGNSPWSDLAGPVSRSLVAPWDHRVVHFDFGWHALSTVGKPCAAESWVERHRMAQEGWLKAKRSSRIRWCSGAWAFWYLPGSWSASRGTDGDGRKIWTSSGVVRRVPRTSEGARPNQRGKKNRRIGEASNPGPRGGQGRSQMQIGEAEVMQQWSLVNITGFSNAQAALALGAQVLGVTELRGEPRETSRLAKGMGCCASLSPVQEGGRSLVGLFFSGAQGTAAEDGRSVWQLPRLL